MLKKSESSKALAHTPPKNTSARQIAANRRNAAKSTGPRIPAGRAVSKLNALKHGILSREVLVRGQAFEEDETKLERQLYRAMAQLERVQRLRNGEAVPAPWSVQVSERG